MVVKLIAKDKEKKFKFQGRCKLIINSVSKLLLVEPFNEDFKMISAMFQWKFVAQKNILFVFAENGSQDFAIIFDDTNTCNKTFNILIKKGATPGNNELIKERIFPSLFNGISTSNESSFKLKEILTNWIELFDSEEKQEYIQILKDNSIYDSIYSCNVTGQNRKRKAKDITHGCKKSSKGIPKRSNLRLSNKIVEAPNFKVLKYVFKDVHKIKLSVFPTTSDDRTYCYEYYTNNKRKSDQYFVCTACRFKKKWLSAKIIKRNGKDAVLLNSVKHACGLREYKEIIGKPNYEVFSYECRKGVTERLILFLDSFRETCYEYYWDSHLRIYRCCGCTRKNRQIGANICEKEDGTEFVMLRSNQHVCEPRKFNPEKYNQKEIVETDNFKIFKNIQNGKDKSKLVIFVPSDKTTCYEYYWDNLKKTFVCCGCKYKNKIVAAKICQHNDGSNYLKLTNQKHVCEPREYNPEKLEMSNEVMKTSNFKIFKYMHNGAVISRLIVFCETNKNLCYEYFWDPRAELYWCCSCPRKNQVSGTVINGEKENLILSKTQHVCKLRQYDPEKYKDDIIVPKSMYKITSTILKHSKDRTMAVFTSAEKKLYYKFHYDTQRKYFYCYQCLSAKINVTATIQNEGNENEFLYVSNQKHVCEPLEYSFLTNGYIIQEPNYQLVKRKAGGKIMQRMVVFTNEEKSECYEYTYQEKAKAFVCFKCSRIHKIFVYAKIFKNDANEDCVELSEKIHKCKPCKFIPEQTIEITTAVVKLPGFKLYEVIRGGKNVKKLAIFDSKNRNMGYIYFYRKNRGYYECSPCAKNKKCVTAKVLQDESGQKYVKLNTAQHVCKLQKL